MSTQALLYFAVTLHGVRAWTLASPFAQGAPSHATRCASAAVTMQLPDIGKMGSDVMSKMGMGGDMGMSDDEQKSMEERLRNGAMTFADFQKQVEVMQKGAGLQAMMGKFSGNEDQIKEGQKKMERYADYIRLMEEDEREDPDLLINEADAARRGGTAARLERLATASGVTVEDVGRFVLEFKMMRSAAVKFANGESPDSIKQSMMEEQQESGPPLNRQQRRMQKKKMKKKGAAGAGGFGRR